MNIKVTFVWILLGISLWGYAQQNDSTKTIRNINIEREYTPEITPVERPSLELVVEEPKIEKSAPSFSDYSPSYKITPTAIIPLQAKEIGALNRVTPKEGYMRFGVGVLFSWLADFWYPVWNTKDGYFDISLHHDGIFSIGKPPKKLINTTLGVSFNKDINDNLLYIKANYSNELFNYYGRDDSIQTDNFTTRWDTIFTAEQSFNKADILLGFRTKERTSDDWLWNAAINYHLHSTSSKISEHNLNLFGKIDKLIDENALVADFGVMTYFYQNRDSVFSTQLPTIVGIDSARWKTNAIIYLNPKFMWNFESIKLQLGLKSHFSFGRSPVVAISPDVKMDYFLNDFLNLYLGVGGDYKINSLANTTARNRYYNLSATDKNTYSPFDVYGGFKVKVLKGLMLDAGVSYSYVYNEIFFKNDAFIFGVDTCYNRYFNAAQYDGALFRGGVRLSYNIKERTQIFASINYINGNMKQVAASDTVSIPWHTPSWNINAGSEFKIGKNFFGSINFYFASKMKAERSLFAKQDIITLPAAYDLNLGMGYNISKNFSIFAQLNNILAVASSLNYQDWYGYKTMGFNALIGLTALF